MSEVKSISLPREMAVYVETKHLSASKILQSAIKRLMDGQEDAEYYRTRCELLALKLQDAINFIEKEGKIDVFWEQQAARAKSKGSRGKARPHVLGNPRTN